jgi:DNA-directed RNA polymerase specialized sigma24 family protein
MGELPEGDDWGEMFVRLYAYGTGKMRMNPADAEQIAQEALLRFVDPKYASWDREKEPSLLRHLGSIFNGVARDMRTKKAFNQERLSSSADQPDQPDVASSQEDRVFAADQVRQGVGRMLELSAGKKVVQDVIMLMAEEVDGAAEQARRLGLPIARIYEARRTVTELVDVVRAELEVEV